MTPQEFKQIRKTKGLSCQKMANLLGLKAGRTVERYESGEIEIPGTIIKGLELIEQLTTTQQALDSAVEALECIYEMGGDNIYNAPERAEAALASINTKDKI
jgi:transcriptional regulator with XRE-family HTH domain